MYYISMQNSSDGTWHFFTYDTVKRIWSREDDMKALMFCQRQGRIYFVNETTGSVMRYYKQTELDETALNWSVTSNVIGYDLAENEYVSRFVVRCETTGSVHLEIRYGEDGAWIDKGTKTMNGLGSFVLPVAPRRCDHLRYRFSGNKPIKIFSITKYVQVGSDVHW